MRRAFFHWIFSALAIGIVSRIVPGFIVTGVEPALVAALVIGFINATLGLVLKLVTLPLEILTLGLFWFIINAAMIKLASAFVPGFLVLGFAAAFWGGLVLSFINMIFRHLFGPIEG